VAPSEEARATAFATPVATEAAAAMRAATVERLGETKLTIVDDLLA
jgi:hypothetical protein